jgi:hypothetical protein
VIACVVFVLLGAVPSREMLRERHRLRNGFVAAVVLLVLVAIPLASRGYETAQSMIRSTTGAPIVRAWIGGRDLEVTSYTVAGDTVTLHLAGSDPPPSSAALAGNLAQAFGAPVELNVNYTAVSHERATAAP